MIPGSPRPSAKLGPVLRCDARAASPDGPMPRQAMKECNPKLATRRTSSGRGAADARPDIEDDAVEAGKIEAEITP